MKCLLACALLTASMAIAQPVGPPPGSSPQPAEPLAAEEPTVLSPAVEAAAEEVMPEAVVDQVENVASEVAHEEGQAALLKLLGVFAGIMGSIWIAAEFIGNAAKIEKSIVALTFGPIAAVICWALGWVVIKDGWIGFVAAAFFGLISAAVTGSLHRQVVQATSGGKP